jgi:hypothetical protein
MNRFINYLREFALVVTVMSGIATLIGMILVFCLMVGLKMFSSISGFLAAVLFLGLGLAAFPYYFGLGLVYFAPASLIAIICDRVHGQSLRGLYWAYASTTVALSAYAAVQLVNDGIRPFGLGGHPELIKAFNIVFPLGTLLGFVWVRFRSKGEL